MTASEGGQRGGAQENRTLRAGHVAETLLSEDNMSDRRYSRLSRAERELALRLETELKDKRDLTTGHPLQTFRPIDRRTRHHRLALLKIAEIEEDKYRAVLLRRGPEWTGFAKSAEGESLRNKEFIQELEIKRRLHQEFRSSIGAPSAARRVIKIRRPVEGAPHKEGTAKIVRFRPRPLQPKKS